MKIDFGHVTMLMRDMLHGQGKERFDPAKAAGLKFLELENPLAVRACAKAWWNTVLRRSELQRMR